MCCYKAMYHILFNASTDAIELLDAAEPPRARTELVRAQRKAEELYLAEKTRPCDSEEE